MPGQAKYRPRGHNLQLPIQRHKRLPYGQRIVFLHMRKNDVLRMAHAQFVMRIAFGQIRHQAHLVGRGVTRNAAFGLK